MPTIILITEIKAPVSRVFDLARSIDLHQNSLRHTDEKAVGGRTSGLIEEGETVTWEAKHLGRKQRLTSLITDLQHPFYFEDVMIKGAFKTFKHEHHFTLRDDGYTVMRDVFDYVAPLGVVGKLADALFLENYMTRLLKDRNAVLKQTAESDEWQNIPGIS